MSPVKHLPDKKKIKVKRNISQAELNIFHIFRRNYIKSRCFGLMPFTIRWNANNTIDGTIVTVFDILWFLAALGIYLTLAYFTVAMYLYSNLAKAMVLFIGRRIILFLGLIFGFINICMDMFNRNRIVKIFNDFYEFDQIIGLQCVQINFGRQKTILLWVNFATVAISIFYFIISLILFKTVDLTTGFLKEIAMYASYYGYNITFNTVNINYWFLLLSIRNRYALINKLIKYVKRNGAFEVYASCNKKQILVYL